MRKLIHLLKTNFMARMAWIALCFLLLPCAVMLILTASANYRSAQRQTLLFNQELMDAVCPRWEESLEQIVQIPQAVYSASPQIQNALRNANGYTPAEREALTAFLEEQLSSNEDVVGMDITGANGERLRAYTFVSQSRWQTYAQSLPGEDGFYAFPSSNPDFGAWTISLMDYPSYDRLAKVTVYYAHTGWDALADTLSGAQEGYAIQLVDEEGEVLYSSGQEGDIHSDICKSAAGLYYGSMGGTSGYYSVRILSVRDRALRLVKFFPSAVVTNVIAAAVWPVVLIDLFLLLCILLYLVILHRDVILPIRSMAGNMAKVQNGIYEYQSVTSSQDEIGVLDRQYEKMVTHIDRLINQEMRHELELTQSKLKTLQAQISPHFLNNMLQMVSTSALTEGADETNDMICSLARMLQYNMEIDRETVTLGEELTHLGHYLKLQNQRYEGRIQADIRVDGLPCQMVRMPKMILQPMAENAIKYSHLKEGGNCHLVVSANLQGDQLCLRIADDGLGISPEKQAEIRRLFEQDTMRVIEGHGIGLLNVLFRLRISFGDSFTWDISDNDPGCKITLLFRADAGES